MRTFRFVIAATSVAILAGCSNTREATFVAAIAKRPSRESANHIVLYDVPEIDAHRRVLESKELWRRYVEPELTTGKARARDGFSVTSGRVAYVGDDLTFEFKIRFRKDAEEVFALVRDGYVASLLESQRQNRNSAASETITHAEQESNPALRTALLARAAEIREDKFVPRILSSDEIPGQPK